ncbi:helix-turn-helix domain-containing protein [Salinisphaera sp. P385]|uniref:Helix-turn-helix domain-containing protein n=1 Tax=Spectribacter acetivorans TaxID=3075603 RepID=A0ABU3B3L7_9GAMM|nr:helix-turn-helix domain-containing protein [Salinisphaera sp. P385]MDT0617049.1 helix-turn-helix domain-containing protein [Salinisphaera sp. P385]
MDQVARTTKQIGASIRRRRRALGLRQGDVGDKTNLRQATISALENGESGTQLRTLVDVMAALDLELVVRERSRAADIEDVF